MRIYASTYIGIRSQSEGSRIVGTVIKIQNFAERKRAIVRRERAVKRRIGGILINRRNRVGPACTGDWYVVLLYVVSAMRSICISASVSPLATTTVQPYCAALVVSHAANRFYRTKACLRVTSNW